jgi:DNA-binding NtrC family response regulator
MLSEGVRMGHGRILVVDSDPVIRSGICSFLVDQGFVVADTGVFHEAQEGLQKFRPDALILDVHLPNGGAPQLMMQATTEQPPIPMLLLGSGPAVQPLPGAAGGTLTKPVEMTELHTALTRLLRKSQRVDAGQSGLKLAPEAPDPFVGTSAAIAQLRKEAGRVAASQSPVLIQGETGTGKGVLARWIHRNGPRATRPFLDLNCAGLARELLESELFGHQKGAFTSALSAKQGLLEIAHGGTVFLDEIGDMDLQVQSKLLKVLEEGAFRRLGDVRELAVDIRLISASHRDLQSLVREQRFRKDLYFRVNIVWLQLPALRERREDILPLSQRLLAAIGRPWGRPEVPISASAIDALERYSWPGNIRELRNVLERALVLADSDTLRAEHLQFQSERRAESYAPERGRGTLKEIECAYITHVLQRERGSIERTARHLGIPRSSLYNKMRRFHIAQGTGRPDGELLVSAAAD